MYGFGPIVKNEIKGAVDKFMSALNAASQRQVGAPAERVGDRSLSEELEHVAALRDRGILTPAEFEAAKRRLLEEGGQSREADRAP